MNAPVLKPTCCKLMWRGLGYNSRPCGKPSKIEVDGKHYCGIHNPVAKAEKNAKKQAEQTAKYEASAASQAAAKAKQAELERRAACYDELLEALQRLITNANGDANTGYFNVPVGSIKDAKAAIAKALGE